MGIAFYLSSYSYYLNPQHSTLLLAHPSTVLEVIPINWNSTELVKHIKLNRTFQIYIQFEVLVWGATQKILKFVCPRLTAYQNGYLPSSPSK
jgi:hypothetical protein